VYNRILTQQCVHVNSAKQLAIGLELNHESSRQTHSLSLRTRRRTQLRERRQPDTTFTTNSLSLANYLVDSATGSVIALLGQLLAQEGISTFTKEVA
jgi:hypothetical protein